MRQQHLLLLAALAIATTSTACSVLVDGALQDRDSGVGIDANVPSSFCEFATTSDGEACTVPDSPDLRVCDDRVCVRSRCQDGFLDTRASEQCDDGNAIDGDGCEFDCTFTCETAADCDDTNPCTNDVCSASHLCTNPPNTATCMLLDMTATCSDGVCPLGCGNGTVNAPEVCDDGNTVSGDGCERDCTPSCTMDSECEDGIACNGVRTCVAGADGRRSCVVTTPEVACPSDGIECTVERCDDALGCVSDTTVNDTDGDGHYATTCAGGDDCDDTSAARHPGNAEVCGNVIDDDCSATTPDDTRTAYFADCDRDRYAGSMTGSMLVCDPPSAPPSSCAGGGWTPVSPVNAASTDCNPGNVDVNPGQTRYFTTPILGASSTRDFDYNCDSMETPQYTYSSSGLYFCNDLRGTCYGPNYYSTAPVCGASNRVSRCGRNVRTGACAYETAATAPVACR